MCRRVVFCLCILHYLNEHVRGKLCFFQRAGMEGENYKERDAMTKPKFYEKITLVQTPLGLRAEVYMVSTS